MADMRVPRPALQFQNAGRRLSSTTNGTTIRSRAICGVLTTDGDGLLPVLASQHIACPSLGNDTGSAVARNYQYYRFNSIRYTFTPNVGTNYAGTIAFAFYTEPKIMKALRDGTYAAISGRLSALATNSLTSRFVKVGESITFDVPLIRRHTRYLCVADEPTTTDELDDAVHGVLLAYATGVTASVSLGTLTWEYTASLSEPQLHAITGT